MPKAPIVYCRDAHRLMNSGGAFPELTALEAARIQPVEDALREVNGRATSFAITSFNSVAMLARQTERELEARGVTLKNRNGALVTYTGAGPAANAYKFGAASTTVVLRRNSAGVWSLTGVQHATVYPKQAARRRLFVSPAARDDIVRHALEGIDVHQEAAAVAA